MTWETSETCETVVETYVDHRRSTSWIPNAKEVDRKAPLLGSQRLEVGMEGIFQSPKAQIFPLLLHLKFVI